MAKQETNSVVLEREYVVPLRRSMDKVASYRRAERAISEIRKFMLRHMKVYDKDEKKIKISKWVNEAIWERSIKNPPSKIKVKAVKYSLGNIEVELAELPKKALMAKQKEEKLKEEAMKAMEGRKDAEQKLAEEQAKQDAEKVKDSVEQKVEEKQKEIEEQKEEIMKHEVKIRQKDIPKPKKEVHKKALTGI